MFGGHSEPLAAPDPCHPVQAHVPALILEQGENPAVVKSTVFAGQRHKHLNQRLFTRPLWVVPYR